MHLSTLKWQLLYGQWHLEQSEKTSHKLGEDICNPFNQVTSVHIHNEQSHVKIDQ